MKKLGSIILAIAALTAICNADTITWSAPETTPAGSSPAVTGYEVWEETTPGTWALDQSLGAGVTSATVSAGTYAVRALYSGGRTALSDPVTTNDWYQSLPAVDEGVNTVESTDSRATIQAAIDGLSAGDTLYFHGGTYSHSTNNVFLTVGVNGTSGNEINLVAVPGEVPILKGVFDPATENDTGPANEPFALVRLQGDYLRFYGFELKEAGGSGLVVDGSHILVEECNVHDNWGMNIVIGDHNQENTDDVTNVTIRHCVANNSREGGGIFLRPEDNAGYVIDDITVERCITNENGFDSTGVININGGGNSDGIFSFKTSHTTYLEYDTPYVGRANRCRNFHVIQNIVGRNGDDGVDINTGDGTLLLGNIIFDNHPGGGKGAKMFVPVFEDHSYVGNVTLGSTTSLATATEIHFTNGTLEPMVGETVTGATSGATATIDSFDIFSNAGGSWAGNNAEGRIIISGKSGEFEGGELLTTPTGSFTNFRVAQVTGPEHRVTEMSLFYDSGGTTAISNGDSITGGTSGATAVVETVVALWAGSWAGGDAEGLLILEAGSTVGTFQEDEAIEVSATDRATVHAISGDIGYGTDGIGGRVNEINWTSLNHAPPGHTGHGISWADANNARNIGEARNNLSYNNDTDTPATTAFTSSTNHYNAEVAVPDIHDEDYQNPGTVLTGTTIQEKWRNKWRTVMNNIMPTTGGNMDDNGTLDTDYHHATAADHSTTPSDPSDLTKMHWHGTVPDIGASQFFELWAPVVSVGAVSTGGLNVNTLTIGP